MKTSPVTSEDLARSVLSVPPLCLTADLALAEAQNKKLVRHIEAGRRVDHPLGRQCPAPALGAQPLRRVLGDGRGHRGGGQLGDPVGRARLWQADGRGARRSKGTRFPCAMLLPMPAHTTPAGVLRGLLDFVQASGKPAILYVRQADYVDPEAAAKLVGQRRDRGASSMP